MSGEPVVQHPRTAREVHAAVLAAGLAATFALVLALVGSGLGYTVSLIFFLAPSSILCGRLAGAPPADRRALAATALSGGVGGLVLDGVFAERFFAFPAAESTLGVTLPALAWSGAAAAFPVEELVFYVTGSVFIAALYLWCDLAFVPEPVERHARVARPLRSPFVFDGRPAALAAMVVLAAWGLRAGLAGFGGPPEYLSFQACMLGILGAVAWRVARLTINWRAFVVTQLTVLLVSLCWEVTLALPRGWWSYREAAMLGIFIGPWHRLPIEAAVMWFGASWGLCVVVEFYRVAFRRGAPASPAPPAREEGPWPRAA